MSIHPESGHTLNGILPWTRSCFVCGQDNPHGLRLRSRIENGVVLLDYTTREADLGYQHLVHGGIAMTLLDEVMTWAAIVQARRICVAAETTTRLKQPIRVGQKLRITGKIDHHKSKLILTAGTIRDEAGEMLATGSGKYIPMPPEHLALCSDDFVASPDAIPWTRIVG